MTRIACVRWLGLAFAALLSALVLATPAAAQNYGIGNGAGFGGGSSRIKCESWQFRPARCNVPGITDAQLINVIAGDCRPGNWGSDREGVFVVNGCRAFFNVTTRGGGNGGGNGGGWGNGGGGGGNNIGQIVRCESWQFRPARCAMNTNGGVRIQRVVAGDCRPGNWGFDRNGVWVSNGCRADFISGNGGGGNGGGGNGGGGWGGNPGFQTIDCNSIDYRPARCNVQIRSNVQIDRVLGGECIQNRSWGWDRGGIWVNNGCRARFRVF